MDVLRASASRVVCLCVAAFVLCGFVYAGSGAESVRAASSDDALDLGAVPPACGDVGKDYADPSCTTQTRLGDFTLSPHVVHAGGVLTGTVALHCDCPIDWPAITILTEGAQVGTPVEPTCGERDTTCTWRVPKNAPTLRYQIVTVGITNEQGRGISKDYFAVVGKDRFLLSGTVTSLRDPNLPPQAVSGAEIVMSNGKDRRLVETDGSGKYSVVLKRGRYSVTPRGGTYSAKESADCRSAGASCSVVLNQDRVADFVLDPNLRVDAEFDPPSIVADGFQSAKGVVTVKDSRDAPVAGEKIQLSPPITLDPPGLICGPTRRLWPTRFGDGSLFGGTFERLTDDAGRFEFDVRAGTDYNKGWLLEASRPGSTVLGEFHYEYLELSGSTGGIAPELPSLMKTVFTYHPISAEGGDGYDAQIQNGTLEALARAAHDTSSGSASALAGLDFGPIRSVDASGREHAAVVLYSRSPATLARLKAHFASGGAVPPPDDTRVLYTSLLAAMVNARGAPPDLPTLAEWENGRLPPGPGVPPIPANGPAQGGRLEPVPEEDLTYFGWPYPPPLGTFDRVDFDSRCLRPAPNQVVATVHSPLNLVFKDSAGRRLGVDKTGRRLLEIPGGTIGMDKRREAEVYVVPAGSYSVSLLGTGRGRASVVVTTPQAARDRVQVLELKSARGGTGSVKIGPKGVATAVFRGTTVAPEKDVPMRVVGFPRSARAGKSQSLTVRIKDEFGEPVAGARGAIKARGYSISGLTDAAGRMKLKVKPPRSARALKARFLAFGRRTVALRMALRGRASQVGAGGLSGRPK